MFAPERLEEVPGAETLVVFRAEEEGPHYANGAVLTAFKGRFYCMWQASERDEDSPDTRLVYAVSADAVGRKLDRYGRTAAVYGVRANADRLLQQQFEVETQWHQWRILVLV